MALDYERRRRDQSPRKPDGRRTSRLGSLVQEKLVDRGRAALAGVETARANVEAVGASIRDVGRGSRRPRAPLGPPDPATGIPSAPAHQQQRSAAQVASLLPRSFEPVVRRARGDVAPLGWTGEIFQVDDGALRAIVRRLPGKQLSPGKAGWRLVEEMATGLSSPDEDPRVVELLDPEGQVLLRSTPVWRRCHGGGWTVRDVALAEGTPVAEIVKRQRRALVGEVVPAGTVRAAPASMGPWDMDPRQPTAGRVWRGAVELASIRSQVVTRSLTVGDLHDDDAILTWAEVLSWWGGGRV